VQARKNQKTIDQGEGYTKSDRLPKRLSSTAGPTDAKKNFLDITALIRSFQRAEGQADCFQSGMLDCDQVDCKWRPFCFEGHPNSDKD
jgi:hypothetical protein